MYSISSEISECNNSLQFSVQKFPIKLQMYKAVSDILSSQYDYHEYENALMKIPFHLGCYKRVQVRIPEKNIHITYSIQRDGDDIAITL